jgi:hypothetical protein
MRYTLTISMRVIQVANEKVPFKQWWQSFSEFQPVLAGCFYTHRVTGSSTDSGRPSLKKTVGFKGIFPTCLRMDTDLAMRDGLKPRNMQTT